MIYERYCDLLRRDLIKASDGPCNHQRACRRRSYADTMHVVEFKYQQNPYPSAVPREPVHSNPAYDAFVDMKLVSRQMRAEFSPVWLGRWAFQLPRPQDPLSEDLHPSEDDPDDFAQVKNFFTASRGSEHVRRLRLTRHLRAQAQPETAVGAESTEKLASMLQQCDGEYHDQLIVHVQVRCCNLRPSNRRASKDVLFSRKGSGWECLCDGSVTVSFERGWA